MLPSDMEHITDITDISVKKWQILVRNMGRDVFPALFKSHFLPFIHRFFLKDIGGNIFFLIGFVFAKHVGGNVGRCCRDCVPPVDPKQPPRKDNLPPVFVFMMPFFHTQD